MVDNSTEIFRDQTGSGRLNPVRGLLLEELVHALDLHQVFAVIDAASFDFLQDRLTGARLTFDPLYLDEVDAPSTASGPHLVHPTGPRQIETILDLVGDNAGCVWWCLPDERAAGSRLRKHLRSLAMVEIPVDRFDAPARRQTEQGYEPVLFRHADGGVLTAVLPVLDPAQLCRLFGPARRIMFRSPKHRTDSRVATLRAENPDTDIVPSRGLLRFNPHQYEAIADERLASLRPAVDRYLRTATPERHQEHGTAAYESLLTRILSHGRAKGLRGTKAFCRFGLMVFASNGQSLDSRAMNRLLSHPNTDNTADMRIEKAFESFVGQLESQT